MTRDLVVFVPGIMGSVLSSGGTEVWNASLRTVAHDLRRFDEFTRVLRLPAGVGDDAPAPGTEGALTATDLVGGWNIWPGKWVGSGYHNAVRRLRERFRGGGQVAPFAYDWRLSIRYNAAELGRFVDCRLEKWRKDSKNADARAVLLCHSMGGLVAAHLVNHRGGGGLISAVVTVGTPYSGSVKALRYLAGGDPLIPDGITDTLRTFPSLQQLLPTYRCVRGVQGMTLIGAAGLPGISSEMIRDAIAIREQSAWPTVTGAGTAAIPLHVFGGYRYGTLTSVQVTSDALVYYDTWLEDGSAPGSRPVETNPRGDGTVPRFSAVPHNWTRDKLSIFQAEAHGKLLDHPILGDLAMESVDGTDPRGYLDGGPEIGLDLPGLAASSAPIPLRVTTSAEDAPGTSAAPPIRLTATVTDLRDNPEGSEIPLRPDPEGGYRADLRLRPGSWQVRVGIPGSDLKTQSGDVIVVC